MANDVVDVLIIGAGASSAAAAWSLADTKMRILCRLCIRRPLFERRLLPGRYSKQQ